MVVVKLDLPCRPRKRHRELAARVVVAEKNVGNGAAVLIAEKPALDDGRRIARQLGNRQRATVHQHDDDRFAGPR